MFCLNKSQYCMGLGFLFRIDLSGCVWGGETGFHCQTWDSFGICFGICQTHCRKSDLQESDFDFDPQANLPGRFRWSRRKLEEN